MLQRLLIFSGRRVACGMVLLAMISSCAAARATAKPPASATAKASALLPKTFAGWQLSSSRAGTDPAAADAANTGILKEYRFTDFEEGVYTRPDQRRITVKAARFSDASGAYGAFTFYKLPEMQIEKFGDRGASLNERALFFHGNVLVEVRFDRTTAMSAAELRDLSDTLPLPSGPVRNLPTLPEYLPREAYVANSVKYVMGPLALAAVGSPIPPEQVDFTRSAEVAEAKYSTSHGIATLMLISYPTPQIASERLRAFEALNSNSPAPVDSSLASPLVMKRTGPIVAVTAGQLSPAEAKSILAAVNYEAEVTWNQNTYSSKKNDMASLLLNVIVLIGVIAGFMLVIGIAFGGVRIAVKRLFPGRVFDRAEDMEIIQLRLGADKKST